MDEFSLRAQGSGGSSGIDQASLGPRPALPRSSCGSDLASSLNLNTMQVQERRSLLQEGAARNGDEVLGSSDYPTRIIF